MICKEHTELLYESNVFIKSLNTEFCKKFVNKDNMIYEKSDSDKFYKIYCYLLERRINYRHK